MFKIRTFLIGHNIRQYFIDTAHNFPYIKRRTHNKIGMVAVEKIEKISQKTVVDQVMEKIKQLIADGVYAPGDKIPTETELASQFGIGRSSIREAIKIFNYLGILQSRASRGTIVCERSTISSEILSWVLLLGDDDQKELVELRGAIELWSLICLTSLIKEKCIKSEDVIAQLEEQVAIMEQAIENKDQKALKKADYDFHYIIIKGGDNHLFVSLYEILRTFMMIEIEQTHMKYTMQMKIVEEHRELIHAITSGDLLEASTTYKAHIENIKSLLETE